MVDYGRDYTGLANYLFFDHWTPEQGGHRWKQTKNLKRPEREGAYRRKTELLDDAPSRPPKGYVFSRVKKLNGATSILSMLTPPKHERRRKRPIE